jgi:Pyruvate phosphate dikinase, AMP/ATP-binding domain
VGVAIDVPRFDRDLFGSGERFTRIGRGELGGKASGLILAERALAAASGGDDLRGFEVGIPRLTVLATGVFDEFMSENALWDVARSGDPDRHVALAFQRAQLPVGVVGDLRGLVEKIHTPLAVRSSSLLEDALEHPFAGVYATKMTPNNQPDPDTRFRRLVEAVKFVYASTFSRNAVDFRRAIGKTDLDEKMAVIVQEVVGSRHGDRFYPDLSGVARSFNFYSSARGSPEEGIANLALGLGKTIVDGGVSWAFCPARPKAPPPYDSARDLVARTQLDFWAVNMGKPPDYDPAAETEYLVRATLADAEADGVLALLASTYDGASDRLLPGTGARGPRVLTFAPLLVLELRPVARLVEHLLDVARKALGHEVEIEFAATIPADANAPARLGFLQARAMSLSTEPVEILPGEADAPDAIVASASAMGNGIDRTIRDIVYVAPDRFDAAATRDIAAEIASINHALHAEARPYLLIGFGRWGTQDPWLGIPVDWSQISGARSIVEASLPGMQPDPSQGSHFFHNITAFGVSYFTIGPAAPGRVDWAWLARESSAWEGRFVRHVRLDAPLTLKIDGRRGAGVIRRAASA